MKVIQFTNLQLNFLVIEIHVSKLKIQLWGHNGII